MNAPNLNGHFPLCRHLEESLRDEQSCLVHYPHYCGQREVLKHFQERARNEGFEFVKLEPVIRENRMDFGTLWTQFSQQIGVEPEEPLPRSEFEFCDLVATLASNRYSRIVVWLQQTGLIPVEDFQLLLCVFNRVLGECSASDIRNLVVFALDDHSLLHQIQKKAGGRPVTTDLAYIGTGTFCRYLKQEEVSSLAMSLTATVSRVELGNFFWSWSGGHPGLIWEAIDLLQNRQACALALEELRNRLFESSSTLRKLSDFFCDHNALVYEALKYETGALPSERGPNIESLIELGVLTRPTSMATRFLTPGAITHLLQQLAEAKI